LQSVNISRKTALKKIDTFLPSLKDILTSCRTTDFRFSNSLIFYCFLLILILKMKRLSVRSSKVSKKDTQILQRMRTEILMRYESKIYKTNYERNKIPTTIQQLTAHFKKIFSSLKLYCFLWCSISIFPGSRRSRLLGLFPRRRTLLFIAFLISFLLFVAIKVIKITKRIISLIQLKKKMNSKQHQKKKKCTFSRNSSGDRFFKSSGLKN
jgi:hypothetical protein